MTNYEKIQPDKKCYKSNPVTLSADKKRISLIPPGQPSLFMGYKVQGTRYKGREGPTVSFKFIF